MAVNMDWNLLFQVGSQLAMVGWLILIFGPRRYAMLNRVPGLFIPLLLAVPYALTVVTQFASMDGGFGSLAEVRQLFAADAGLTAGWLHYLAFDLLVGAWLAIHMDAVRLSRIIQAPILLAVFLFGPLGWLLGMGTCAAKRSFKATPSGQAT